MAAGRAGPGAAGRSAAAVLIARDDPLDTYLVRHPEILLRHPVEATVLDPDNPYVLAPHLCAAAAELALTEQDLDIFGPAARTVVDDLTRAGRLRRRPAGWYSMRRDAAAAAGLRGAGLAPVRVVEEATGRLVGTVDEPSAHLIVHEGAIYVHQGDSYLVATLDLADRVALVEPCEPGLHHHRQGRDRDRGARRTAADDLGPGRGPLRRRPGDPPGRQLHQRRDSTGAALGETPLDLPPRHLQTRAVWWTVSADQADALTAAGVDLGGAAHAAEHAAIGLLPLFATCDRWDIGGVSAARHPATGMLTVFVYDGHDGGAGFAERGFQAAADWLRATRQAIASCDCEAGCPSCVQSPKCGNANHPLSKRGAVALLDTLLAGPDALRAESARFRRSSPSQDTSASADSRYKHEDLTYSSTLAGRKRRRAPPGGRAAPARTVRPWGGGRLRPIDKLIRKVPPYATTSVGFATAGGVSATGTRCSVSPIELQHMSMGLGRVYGQIGYPEGSLRLPGVSLRKTSASRHRSRRGHRTLSANNGDSSPQPSWAALKPSAVGYGPRTARPASHSLTACDRATD